MTEATGLKKKYIVTKADGSSVDPDAQYFVLRIDTDRCARLALRTYARAIEWENPSLADGIFRWLTESRARRKAT